MTYFPPHTHMTATYFSKPVSRLLMKKEKKTKEGFGTGAEEPPYLAPNLCAVTALWKYHLFLAAKGAWPSDCLYLHSAGTTRSHLEIPGETESIQNRIFAFPSYARCFWRRTRSEFNIYASAYVEELSQINDSVYLLPARLLTWPGERRYWINLV